MFELGYETKQGSAKEDLFAEFMGKNFHNIKQYTDELMQGKWGFYNGRVDFREDFVTCASSPARAPRFAASVAYQLLCVHKKLLSKIDPATGKPVLGKDDAFNVLECGGGTGNLCLLVFEYIEKMAKKDKEWAALLRAIHYHLVERAPALVAAQKKHNAHYVKLGKVTVTQGDALKLSEVLPDTKMAVAVSNELIDMLQPHAITMDKDGNIKVKQVLPFIPESALKKLVTLDVFERLKKESKEFEVAFTKHGKKEYLSLFSKELLLSKESFLMLHQLYLQKNLPSAFTFKEVAVLPVDSVPEVEAFLTRHPQFVARMQPEKPYLVHTDILPYLRGVKEKLLPGAEVISIDYGSDDDIVSHKHCTYEDAVLAKDIYDKPGRKDVTTYMPTTIMDEEGQLLGLHTAFCNDQISLRVDAFPPDVLSAEDIRVFKRKNPPSYFKVMVQVNGPETPEASMTAQRFTGPSLPVSYAELASQPPLYTINSSGQLTIHLTPSQIGFIDLEIYNLNEQIKMLTPIDGVVEMNIPQLPGNSALILQFSTAMIAVWNKVKNKQPLDENEKKAIQKYLPTCLSHYPTVEQVALESKRIIRQALSQKAATELPGKTESSKPSDERDSVSVKVLTTKTENPLVLYQTGVKLFKENNVQGAKDHLKNALVIFKRTKGIEAIECAKCYSALSSCYRDMKKQTKAVKHCEKALSIFYANSHENLANTLKKYHELLAKDNLTDLYNDAVEENYKKGDYVIASYKMEFVLERMTTLQEKAHCHSNLASCYRELKNIPEAIRHCDQALALRRQEKPMNPSAVAQTLSKLEKLQQMAAANDSSLTCGNRQ